MQRTVNGNTQREHQTTDHYADRLGDLCLGPWVRSAFCHGDEENERRACTNGNSTTADQSEIRKAYLALREQRHR